MTLRCIDWSAGKGKFPVFANWNVSVHVGEVVVVLGPNGVGKTTLLESLIGAANVYGGILELDGTTVAATVPTSERARRGLVYVPEGRGIFTRLSVFENLAMGVLRRSSLADVRRMAEPILDDWPILRPLLTRRAGLISGGEAQTLAFARGLMSAPRYLLVDEPTRGLAPIVVADVVESIRRIRSKVGVLITEQNVPFSLSVADRVFVASSAGQLFTADPTAHGGLTTAVQHYLGLELSPGPAETETRDRHRDRRGP